MFCLPMTYDLEVILKYCGRSSYDLWACVDCLRSLLVPLCAVLGRSWGLCWRFGGGLGTYVGDLGPPRALLAALGPLLGRSWALLGCSWRLLGRSWPPLGCSWPLLAGSWPLLGRSWPVLGRSWSLCWRSWRLLGPLLAVLGRLGLKKVEEHEYLESMLISRAGARSAASGAVLGRS